jgi:hypothetical protein
VEHHKVDPPRLHNDLNRLVDQTNSNFVDHATQLATAHQTIATQATQITALLARVLKLENAQS